MDSKIKNLIILAIVATVLILIYIFFLRKTPEPPLISSSLDSALSDANTESQKFSITKDFLSLLLNVKNIKLDDTIFSDLAFNNLHDSSIILTPDGNEGRPNPFAPLGSDNVLIQP